MDLPKSVLFIGTVFIQILYTVLALQYSCDVCKHEGQACRRVSGIFTVTVLSRGYNPVIDIPAGACSINITELGPSSNFLALKTATGKGIINGYWSIVAPGDYKVAGTNFRYSRTGTFCPGECIRGEGPTNQTVIVQILYNDKNPGIAYEFWMPPSLASSSPGQVIPHIKEHHRRHPGHRHSHHGNHHNKHGNAHNKEQQDIQTLKQGTYDSNAHRDYRTNTGQDSQNYYAQLYGQQNRQATSISSGQRNYDYRGKSYGNDALEGNRYSQTSGQSASQPQIQFAPKPQYISPYIDDSRGHNSQYQALTAKTYSRGETRYDSERPNVISSHSGLSNAIPVQHADPYRTGQISGSGQYSWKISGFSECSKTCASGFQETNVVCVLTQTKVVVTDDNCDNDIKPHRQHVVCNTSPCPPDWETGEWSECSATCGHGTQTRRVECKQRITATLQVSVSASKCDAQRKPATHQQCKDQACVKWEMGQWGQCSGECGLGQRRRLARCVDTRGIVLPDSSCQGPQPKTTESCDMGPCSQYSWYHGHWSDECSADCGAGVMTRRVYCASERGDKIPDSYCDAPRKPETQQSCRNGIPCGGQWFKGPWGKCSTSCGHGQRSRDVVCMKSVGGGLRAVVSEDNCEHSDKPHVEEACEQRLCGVQWYMSPWTECSASCGGGHKSREVRCVNENQELSGGCSSADKPLTRDTCNIQNCRHRTSHNTPASSCRDRYGNCRVVVQARLCRYRYYKSICCDSCSRE